MAFFSKSSHRRSSAKRQLRDKRKTQATKGATKRHLLLESLDQRVLMAADMQLGASCEIALLHPLPDSHAIYKNFDAYARLESHADSDSHVDSHPSDSHQSDSMFASGFDPDNIDYGTRAGAGSAAAPAASSDNGKWNQPGGLGASVTITYSYAGLLDGNLSGSLSADQLRAAVEESMALWANYAPLNFVEVEDAGPPIYVNGDDNTSYRSTGTPDIRIGHHAIDGNGDTLAYAYYPSTNYWGVSGDIHFDTTENWRFGRGSYNQTDFLEVMTHELGHALGLDHEEDSDAIMNPFVADRYSGLGTSYLLLHDINAVRDIYGIGTGSVTPIIYNDPPVVAVIADQTLSLDTTTFTINVSATDPDGDTLIYDAAAFQASQLEIDAYELKQTHGFRPAGNEAYNYRGQGEKYFYGEGSRWFFMLPDGAIHRWNGSITASPKIAQLDASFHQQLSRLTEATSPGASSVNVTTTWNGSDLVVDINDNTLESFVIQVDVSDQYETTTRSFNVTIADNAPTITPIADQQASVNDGSLTLYVDAVDPEGSSLDLSATASSVDEAAVAAFELKQRHTFRPASNESYNYRGQNEKYFLGEGSRWFFILPSGSVHRWSGSISGSLQVGQVDASYHANLSTLLDATEPQATVLNVDLRWSGNDLTVDWEDSFVGTFVVTVSASDLRHTTEDSFTVTVSNSAPVLTAIGDQSVSVRQGSVTIPVTASDADGDTVQLNATVQQADPASLIAYDLKTQFNLRAARSESYNYRGQGEKYFYGNGSQWFFILPSGSVHRWSGSIGGSPQVGQVDASYHADLSTLLNVTEPQVTDVTVDLIWSGNDLTIDWDDSFVGDFNVTVSASDSIQSTEETFAVTVSNAAPLLAPIADQSMSARLGTITIPVSASDADGDTILLDATLQQVDTNSVVAYNLKTQYALRAAGSESYNYRGQSEKYFYGEGSRWFFILPDGGVYRWTGSIGGSTQVGQVDPSYHQDLTSLTNATGPTMTAFGGDATWSGNDLTIDLPAQFVGRFVVTVTASDGAETTETSFAVDVSNRAPDVATIADQAFAAGQNSLTIPVTASDSDGDTLSFTATASAVDQLAIDAYDLKQTYGLYPTAEQYNYRGHGEKYFRGNGGAWHFILPDGAVYRWTGSITSSSKIGQLDASYHANLSLLTLATEPNSQTIDSALTWSGSDLTITRPTNFAGTFTVTVETTDNAQTTTRSFNVTVGASASTKAPLSMTKGSITNAIDQVMSQFAI